MRKKWFLASALAGVAALVLVLGVVFLFRDEDEGDSQSAADGGSGEAALDLPGEVLYESGANCLTRIRSGRQQEVCWPSIDIAGPLTWLSGDEVATIATGGEPTGVDLVSGAERRIDRVAATATNQQMVDVSPNLETVTVDGEGRVFISRGTPPVQIYDFETETLAQPEPVGWSPDSQWILFSVVPSAGERELWVLKIDGTVAAILAKDLRSPFVSWRIDGIGVFPAVVPFLGGRIP